MPPVACWLESPRRPGPIEGSRGWRGPRCIGIGSVAVDTALVGAMVTLRAPTAADIPALAAIRATPQVHRWWHGGAGSRGCGYRRAGRC